MCRAIVSVMLLSLMLAVGASAQIPPKYEIVQLTENSYFEFRPAINNHDQVVFVRRLGANELSDEIFLCDDGEFMQLTDDDVRDTYPDINDDGTIVWSRGIGPDGPYGPTLEVVIWQDGDLTRLTDDGLDDYTPKINGPGHITWNKLVRGGCHDVNSVICLYDGLAIEQISDADWSHQGPVINDQDWIAWTRYNFCDDPWTSEVMLCVDGDTIQLTDEQVCPRAPTINDAGQVAWTFRDTDTGLKAIQLWEDGETTLVTGWGGGPRLNDRGDMCFHRWYGEQDTYQMWLYLKGSLCQLSDDPFWNVDGDITNTGAVVWASGLPPWGSNLRLLRPAPPVGGQGAGHVTVQESQPLIP